MVLNPKNNHQPISTNIQFFGRRIGIDKIRMMRKVEEKRIFILFKKQVLSDVKLFLVIMFSNFVQISGSLY